MECSKQLRDKSYVFGVLSGLLTSAFIVCLIIPYWLHIKNYKDIGVFESLNAQSNELYSTDCSGGISQTQCGYIQSFQISAVITAIMGALTTFIYFAPPYSFTTLSPFLATITLTIQSGFATITLVLFSLFQKGYYTDDGVNREYPGPSSSSELLVVGYYIWLVCTVLSGLGAIASYVIIQQNIYNSKRGILGLRD